ncbi:MAG: MmcQ/YjbR family DNA-binding protein, partial [Kofleriaceae bacterium]
STRPHEPTVEMRMTQAYRRMAEPWDDRAMASFRTEAESFRKLALAQPGAEEGSHQGHADFRAGGKIFAGLSPDGRRATLKMSLEVQAALGAEPAFEPCAGAWGRAGWTYVDLAAVELGALEDLVREAVMLVSKKPAAKKPAAKKPAAKKSAAKRPARKRR